MDFNAITADLDLTPAELARRLDVSDGHVWDLKSGRRDISLKLAAKLEVLTGRDGLVEQVVRSKVAQ